MSFMLIVTPVPRRAVNAQSTTPIITSSLEVSILLESVLVKFMTNTPINAPITAIMSKCVIVSLKK